MYIQLILYLAFISIISLNIQEQQVINSYYEYVNSTNPGEDSPSKCDCDYKKIELYLSKDFSFLLREQKGRLTILSLDSLYGTWQINPLNELQLNIDSVITDSNTIIPDFLHSKTKKFSPPRIEKIKITKHQLLYDYDKVLLPKGKTIELR
ncbi:hypothetical protein [Aquimarina mytili]|uniref:Uncharacterized protein n=1 Tax=Aquimarina mytili TaxID=874423 RepID=A0A937A451_9FLAO|nr:hypothetical protein [Aquimarina mytili]MBL0684590.1 hypothetical protein [Aquimarina mytili]